MVSVCFYFQVHQPYRLRKYRVFDIGRYSNYFDEEKNREILNKVADKCYLPANRLILDLINETDGKFRVSFSLTGVVLDQFQEYRPEVIDSFQELVDTGCVELLSETYYHSLAFLYSEREFIEQIELHRKKIREIFNYKPKVFRNTELVYNNRVAYLAEKMEYKGVLVEGADYILGWRSPNFLYRPKMANNIKLLLKNYRLSDDIAFRFSLQSWDGWPLTADKFASWINAINGNGNVVNLFMDYETFGEHQWKETGIFEFLRHLPHEILKHPDNNFMTPSEVIKTYEPVGDLDVRNILSWADIERDLSAWLGNEMQRTAIEKLYELENAVKESKDGELLEDWRRLQTADHFYYMCTKWFNDGDVHKYFNAFDRPHDSFIAFMNVLEDMRIRLYENSEKVGMEVKKW
ncbi:MAG: alpha-amylase [Candidatus Altiarchaeales archaeon]|nr:MAG: alpha-amylase [Candidatus Altiarchaeales archaeon]RLI94495.1 MAG: alpha-amylase [Candidatus Altiarchaeales archaeon]RLI95574.1 MAG: alpha-amylase [Candidatus Altiarchaeales archaeon]HDO82594.1 alpha-amylase [Candidatus Altiarchaeales archaeon]HEX55243.1 alpha-amylase [Candidatus Altiarchaeales archaeon]